MELSKTTKNYANKRRLDVTIENFDENEGDVLAVWEADNDCEWMFSYQINDDGSFTWRGNIYLSQDIKEELPATVKDEKHLRQVLDFIAKELAKEV